jgi:phosphoribosylanthranilate isomerase
MNTGVKICGLTTSAAIEAGNGARADYAGFVFYPPSPRHLETKEAAELAAGLDCAIARVALVVNADDEYLERIMTDFAPAIIQAHGSESPARLRRIGALTGCPVWKAIKVRSRGDLTGLEACEEAAARLLFDARPPSSMKNALPGGNALSFDWHLLKGAAIRKPFILAGGLTVANVAEAITLTGAAVVDASSGVEQAPGRKDPTLIRAFVRAVRAAGKQEKAGVA